MLKTIKLWAAFLLAFLIMTPSAVYAIDWDKITNEPDEYYEFKPMYLRDIYWVGPPSRNGSGNMCWYERNVNNGQLTGKTLCGSPNIECASTASFGNRFCASDKEVCVFDDPSVLNTIAMGVVGRRCRTISAKAFTINDPAAYAAKQAGKEVPAGSVLSGAGYSCVTGQTCEVVYDASGNVVDLIFYIDQNLAAGTPLLLNGKQCKHLFSCQKMLTGSVWPYGVVSMKALLSPPPSAEVAKALPLPTAGNVAPAATVGWVAGNGTVPAGAVEIGTQSDGARNHVCRVSYSNAVVTGKLQWGNTCFFGWYGKELSLKQGYEVLINPGDANLSWRPWNDGADWDVGRGGNRKAFVGGGSNGKPIVPCRANFQGGVVGGHFHGNTCFLPYYNVENPVGTFDLLGY